MWCTKLSFFHLVLHSVDFETDTGSSQSSDEDEDEEDIDEELLQAFLGIIKYSPPSISTLLLEFQTSATWALQHINFHVLDRLLSNRSSLHKLEIIFAPDFGFFEVSAEDLEKVQARLPESTSALGDRMAITKRAKE